MPADWKVFPVTYPYNPPYAPNSVIPMDTDFVPVVGDPSFAPPVIPPTPNDTGAPLPPSGLHESDPKPHELITTGPGWEPEHPAGAGTNIHGVGGRAASFLGRVFGREKGSEFA
jgi:hypothetical protein